MDIQTIRLIDIFVLGPFLIWAATKTNLSQAARMGLLVAGVLTIMYNAQRFLETRKV